MQCRLEEFTTLKDAEKYINLCYELDKESRIQIFPYAIEPYKIIYLVALYAEGK